MPLPLAPCHHDGRYPGSQKAATWTVFSQPMSSPLLTLVARNWENELNRWGWWYVANEPGTTEIMNTGYPVSGINHSTKELIVFPDNHPRLSAMLARQERIHSPSTAPTHSTPNLYLTLPSQLPAALRERGGGPGLSQDGR